MTLRALKKPHWLRWLLGLSLLLSVVLLQVVLRPDQQTFSDGGHDAGDRPDDANSLGERRLVEVEGKPLIVDGYAAFPALGDLDGDGRPDLLLGDTSGFLTVYRNIGGPGRLHLAAPVPFREFCDDERITTG
jgi:hypothetical protein